MPAWTDTADRELLLAITHATAQLPKWDQIANMMGEGFTAEAVRYVTSPLLLLKRLIHCSQRFTKNLRKEAKEKFGEVEAGDEKSTPRKSKASETNGATPTKSTGKRKGRKNADGDDEEGTETPTKKIKKEEEQGELE